ncbi:hypothetical protein QWY90_03315 [Flavobacterium paronense]|uniref:PH domain-containing protein n=1 Tax=Flavobacterium paronense TaxID=1392775 RepID=A0ABV5GCM8_9FLAO|nr:hypothetical protein [Flavobacterium paronense]MDN3676337.1 hypothetical protein [Flavobacterium paronense]
MEADKIILKTKINFFSIGLFLIGIIAFGYSAIATIVFPMKSDNNFLDANDLLVLKWIVFGAFTLVFIGCSYQFLSVKIFSLTNQNIIIDYPFLFIKKTIPISTIKRVLDKNNIYMLSRINWNNAIYKEKETTIEFFNGEKITIDLSGATNYLEFKEKFSEIIEANDTTANKC